MLKHGINPMMGMVGDPLHAIKPPVNILDVRSDSAPYRRRNDQLAGDPQKYFVHHHDRPQQLLVHSMMATFLAALLRPFVLLMILGGLLAVRHAVMHWMPDGRIKRLLLREV